MDEMEETESWERASERKGVYRGCLRVSPPPSPGVHPFLAWASCFHMKAYLLCEVPPTQPLTPAFYDLSISLARALGAASRK